MSLNKRHGNKILKQHGLVALTNCEESISPFKVNYVAINLIPGKSFSLALSLSTKMSTRKNISSRDVGSEVKNACLA